MIKLIASDLDGTLLKEGTMDINPEIYDIIRKLTDILHPVRYAAYADIRRKSWHYQNGYTYANVETGWTGM